MSAFGINRVILYRCDQRDRPYRSAVRREDPRPRACACDMSVTGPSASKARSGACIKGARKEVNGWAVPAVIHSAKVFAVSLAHATGKTPISAESVRGRVLNIEGTFLTRYIRRIVEPCQ